ncbi:MAG TPA: hypothetical protein VN767_25585 [Streptosporangiaceae bacterium]|nr:hypothetical protein [Streptosporangiaceae bacterium]
MRIHPGPDDPGFSRRGRRIPCGYAAHPLIEVWTGRGWKVQHTVQTFAPHHADVLLHVSCISRSRCETVGFRFNPKASNSDQTLAEMWNGHRWSLQATANP